MPVQKSKTPSAPNRISTSTSSLTRIPLRLVTQLSSDFLLISRRDSGTFTVTLSDKGVPSESCKANFTVPLALAVSGNGFTAPFSSTMASSEITGAAVTSTYSSSFLVKKLTSLFRPTGMVSSVTYSSSSSSRAYSCARETSSAAAGRTMPHRRHASIHIERNFFIKFPSLPNYATIISAFPRNAREPP